MRTPFIPAVFALLLASGAGAAEPLVVEALDLIETRYPVEMESVFSSPDDPSLEGIRRTDRQLLEMARVYRVPLSRRLAGIYVPQVLP